MSRSPSPFTVQQKLNRMTPAATEAGLGDILNDLITAVNLGISDHNTLIAKLNLDAGVTDTNYAVSGAAVVTVLTSR